jgi:hypothetical protein
MTDDEIFDRELKRQGLGGRLDRRIPAGTPAESLYAEIERAANGMILSARSHVPRLPEIHFDFIHNGIINAYAFKSERRYFVGVTTGTLYMLQVVLNRMLAEHSLFPSYGNPNDEADDLPPLKGYVAHAQKMRDAGHRPVFPRTFARFQCSGYFFFNAFLFLLGHEIAHIARGHVDYMEAEVGSPFVAELTGGGTAPTPEIERQTIEMDADMRSIRAMAASLELTNRNAARFQRPWTSAVPDLETLIWDWAFAMHTLFRLFGDIEFRPSELTRDDYPPLPVRRAIARATSYWAFAFNDSTPSRKEMVLRALTAAGDYCEVSFAKVLGTEVSPQGYLAALGPAAHEHHGRLIACWYGGLRDRVLAFAYDLELEQQPRSTPESSPYTYELRF